MTVAKESNSIFVCSSYKHRTIKLENSSNVCTSKQSHKCGGAVTKERKTFMSIKHGAHFPRPQTHFSPRFEAEKKVVSLLVSGMSLFQILCLLQATKYIVFM